MKNAEEYRRALDGVIWYNGLAPTILGLKWLLLEDDNGIIKYQYNYGAPLDADSFDIAQLQFIWMMGVLMFGEYGSSPRYGWITNIKGFKEWLLEITKIYREDFNNV